MTSAFSWQNSVSLCPTSFCTLRPNLLINSRDFLTSYFCNVKAKLSELVLASGNSVGKLDCGNEAVIV